MQLNKSTNILTQTVHEHTHTDGRTKVAPGQLCNFDRCLSSLRFNFMCIYLCILSRIPGEDSKTQGRSYRGPNILLVGCLFPRPLLLRGRPPGKRLVNNLLELVFFFWGFVGKTVDTPVRYLFTSHVVDGRKGSSSH